jgi:hypothetical protein
MSGSESTKSVELNDWRIGYVIESPKYNETIESISTRESNSDFKDDYELMEEIEVVVKSND